MTHRRGFVRTAAIAMFAIAAFAETPVESLNKAKSGLVVKGYDVVAYFDQGAAVKGSDQFATEWMGAKWLFATAAHRDTFRKDPAKYVPQFGAYCAWAVGHNHTADADPEAWKIVNGKLYLNYSKDVQKMWLKEQDRMISEAEKNWPGLHK